MVRNRHGGGIAIYIRAHVNVNTLQLPHPDLVLILLESYFNSHLYTIGGFYRPPDSGSDYMSKLHIPSSSEFSNLVICGDFNIDQVSGLHQPLNQIL